MEFYANEGKNIYIKVNGKTYARHAITTHFVQPGESYITLIEKYVKPIYQPGDILSSSEKVIALCQGRIVTEEQVRPGFWACLLSRFVYQTEAGPGMGLPMKMQFAINTCGLTRVLWAAVCSALDKLKGIHGTFYRMLGEEVRGLQYYSGYINKLCTKTLYDENGRPYECLDEYMKRCLEIKLVQAVVTME
jgi:hypothetical protein